MNDILEKVISVKYTILNTWTGEMIKHQNAIMTVIAITAIIGLWLFGVHIVPESAVESGKVSKEDVKYHRKKQFYGILICIVSIALTALLGTAMCKLEN